MVIILSNVPECVVSKLLQSGGGELVCCMFGEISILWQLKQAHSLKKRILYPYQVLPKRKASKYIPEYQVNVLEEIRHILSMCFFSYCQISVFTVKAI